MFKKEMKKIMVLVTLVVVAIIGLCGVVRINRLTDEIERLEFEVSNYREQAIEYHDRYYEALDEQLDMVYWVDFSDDCNWKLIEW